MVHIETQVETLMTQLRSTEKKLGDRVKLLEEGQKVEVKKQREAIEAAEKIKRYSETRKWRYKDKT